MDRGAWQAIVPKVTNNRTGLKQLGIHVCTHMGLSGTHRKIPSISSDHYLKPNKNREKQKTLLGPDFSVKSAKAQHPTDTMQSLIPQEGG